MIRWQSHDVCAQALISTPPRLSNYKTDLLSWSNQGQRRCGHYHHLFISAYRRATLRAEVMVGSKQKKVRVLVVQSCPTLCNPMDCSPLGSSVHGISQARILEWAAIPFSRGSSWSRDRTWVSCIAGRFITVWATREARWQRLRQSTHKEKETGDFPGAPNAGGLGSVSGEGTRFCMSQRKFIHATVKTEDPVCHN